MKGIKDMKRLAAITLLLGTVLATAHAADTKTISIGAAQSDGQALPISLQNETQAAINRGLDWLKSQQKPDGSWSKGDFPALTALVLQAFAGSSYPGRESVISNAVAFILSCQQPDGGIYKSVPGKGGGLANYNTAICITALHATGDKRLAPVIQKGRAFVASSQHFGDDVYSGGFGYDRDTGRPYTDLLNTYYAVEAMARTADVEDLRAKNEKRVDINWAETVKYIAKMQNTTNSDTNNAGGFFYSPTDAKAGTATNQAGTVFLRSYGSITYAGMLALIYAQVNRDDVRVQSAFDWAAKHWTLEENPGMGDQGLYFFYNIIGKSLAAYGRDLVPRPDGTTIPWRVKLAEKLISLQKITAENGNGYWKNETGRFWENDPVLITAYTLVALESLR